MLRDIHVILHNLSPYAFIEADIDYTYLCVVHRRASKVHGISIISRYALDSERYIYTLPKQCCTRDPRIINTPVR